MRINVVIVARLGDARVVPARCRIMQVVHMEEHGGANGGANPAVPSFFF